MADEKDNADKVPTECPDCGGSGREGPDPCLLCAGFGTVSQQLADRVRSVRRDRDRAAGRGRGE